MINLYSKTNKNNQVNTSKIYDVKGKIPTVELAVYLMGWEIRRPQSANNQTSFPQGLGYPLSQSSLWGNEHQEYSPPTLRTFYEAHI